MSQRPPHWSCHGQAYALVSSQCISVDSVRHVMACQACLHVPALVLPTLRCPRPVLCHSPRAPALAFTKAWHTPLAQGVASGTWHTRTHTTLSPTRPCRSFCSACASAGPLRATAGRSAQSRDRDHVYNDKGVHRIRSHSLDAQRSAKLEKYLETW